MSNKSIVIANRLCFIFICLVSLIFCAKTSAADTAIKKSASTRQWKNVSLKIQLEADQTVTAKQWKHMRVTAQFLPDERVKGSQELGYEISDEGVLTVTALQNWLTVSDRELVIHVNRSAEAPYVGILRTPVNIKTFNGPDHLKLRIKHVPHRTLSFCLIDDTTGRPIADQPISLMETRGTLYPQEVKRVNTNEKGDFSFHTWDDCKYTILLSIGGPVADFSLIKPHELEITPEIRKTDRYEWHVRMPKASAQGHLYIDAVNGQRVLAKGRKVSLVVNLLNAQKKSRPLHQRFDVRNGELAIYDLIPGRRYEIRINQSDRLFAKYYISKGAIIEIPANEKKTQIHDLVLSERSPVKAN